MKKVDKSGFYELHVGMRSIGLRYEVCKLMSMASGTRFHLLAQ